MATKRVLESEIDATNGRQGNKRQRRTAAACLAENVDDESSSAQRSRGAAPEQPAADTDAMQDLTRVAVLVPFRDSHPAQKRRAHLDAFVPYMTEFLQRHCGPKRSAIPATCSWLTFLLSCR